MERPAFHHRQVGLAWSHFRIRVPLPKNADGAGLSPPLNGSAATDHCALSGTVFRPGHLPGTRLAIDAIIAVTTIAPKTAVSMRTPQGERSGSDIGWRPRITSAEFAFVDLKELGQLQTIIFVEPFGRTAGNKLLQICRVATEQPGQALQAYGAIVGELAKAHPLIDHLNQRAKGSLGFVRATSSAHRRNASTAGAVPFKEVLATVADPRVTRSPSYVES